MIYSAAGLKKKPGDAGQYRMRRSRSEYKLESQKTKGTHQKYIDRKDHIQADGMVGSLFIRSKGIMDGRAVFLHVVVGYNRFIFHFEQVLI